ncbi:MAG: NADH:ubiquinone reductase (Na(+)-transporting) subunit F [Hyphomicrobiales bacterium]|nr:NADH:ubiquinone reductase (Na(+)-transporting) subunit F [Hyphomicrobiales bacterium]
MLEIGLGIALFTGIVLCLVLVILAVRSRLVATGMVDITVNEERTVKAKAGDKLLRVLAEARIYLPSACGGVGTCGQCRVKVLYGGGAMFSTEVARFTKREAAEGMRLACQTMVKEDMAVEVAEEIFGVKHWDCIVRSNANVTPLIKELVLELPPGETIDFRAGGYVQISCPPYQANFADFEVDSEFRAEWDRFDLWRFQAKTRTPTTRAYSMANYPDEKNVIILVARIALPPPGASESIPPGVVSSYIFSLNAGDKVEISGPYGHFFATESESEMVFVGGGAGMAPMRSHIFDQLERLKSKRKITFWYGARSRQDLFYVDDFDRMQAKHDNCDWHIALSEPRPEDHWTGKTGFIHDVLYESYLKDHPAPEDCDYYLCGPPVMIEAVRNMLDNLGVDPENIFFDDFGG